MIRVTVYRNHNHCVVGVCMEGHAGYAKDGEDIVCAAVSMLVLNTINGIEQFTDTRFSCEADEKEGGYLRFSVLEQDLTQDATLLLNVMLQGLCDVKKEYKGSINLIDRGGAV